MNESLLACLEVEPPEPARYAVLWMHGLGADGHDFEPIVPELGVNPTHAVRFVFPHAPRMPVTINGGFVMPAWYDIAEVDLRRCHDEPGIRASALRIEALIQREQERGIEPARIVLAGFSQGGAMALHVGLRHPQRLAGILALSCYLVLDETLEAEVSPANASTPIFQAHGEHDPMVPLPRGEMARDRLRALGHDVQWSTYPMPHAVHPEEIRAVGLWLNERFSAESGT